MVLFLLFLNFTFHFLLSNYVFFYKKIFIFLSKSLVLISPFFILRTSFFTSHFGGIFLKWLIRFVFPSKLHDFILSFFQTSVSLFSQIFFWKFEMCLLYSFLSQRAFVFNQTIFANKHLCSLSLLLRLFSPFYVFMYTRFYGSS